ncbi:MAG TPA: HEAT repeat domain-containing protein [Brevundimonas sp.]
MNPLMLIWWTSLVLAGIAFSWMMGLIVARLFRENSEARRIADQQTLSAAYLMIMSGAGEAGTLLEPFRKRSRLLAESLLEVLSLVRGVERERLIASLIDAGVADRLRSRLTRGSRTGRLAAAEALSAFPSMATRTALRALHRRSTDTEIRIASVRTLIDIGDPPNATELVADLEGKGYSESLLYAPVLRRLAVDAPDDALETLTLPGLGMAARAVMIEAVGASGDYRALPALSLMAAGPEPGLRMSALRALGALAHPGSAETIVGALGDEAWDVRAEAAMAAGRIGGPALVQALTPLLDDPVWWVRFRAAESMSKMGGSGIEALRYAATSQVDVTRRSASLALAEQGLA